ncbi:reticulon B21 [Olea europaea subsp. europaea]|uniref:Reticulon-like protein n=1 Tax=Olea europaea subsp. europaea TaxID=158383 RepID=A0A8S0U680_OLEEU|nr:reticulon B21 [Olea europaea subsp. europaea]
MSTKDATDVGSTSRRRGSAPKAGSVWESRMKSDQVKGGIKVFDATQENSDENKISSSSSANNTEVQDDVKVIVKPKRSPVGVSGKRKTWKSESLEGSPLQIARQRSELGKNLDEQCKELSVSVDGNGNGNGNGNGIKKSPAQFKKTRSAVLSQKGTVEQTGDAIEKSSSQLRKVKSDSNETLTESKIDGKSELNEVKSESSDGNGNGNVKNSLQLQLVNTETAAAKKRDLEGFSEGTEKNPTGIDQSGSDQDCKELILCEEKAITSTSSIVKTPSDDDFVDGEEGEEKEEEWDEEEIDEENEKKSLDIKEITVQEPNPKKIVIEEKKFVHRNERSVPVVKKQAPPAVNHARKIHTSPTKTKPSQVEDDFQRTPRSHSKLESFVDLVMWRDVSKSAFIFGIGTFVIISSSYTRDLNISFISVVSYLGLVYLASIFLFRSLIRRGEIDRSQDYVVGEEEAIWVLKLVLPYINEFLLKLRALFSGDPSTTMKLAVLLFVLARCGSSITIWKMAKLGFFGVFIVPKVCSSYSTQLTAFGTFWIRRFRDAWESCSHKKAVGFAIFTLVWNLSSMVARIWAVFMLFVAFKYYQHSLMSNEWTEEVRNEDSWQGQRQGRRTTLTDNRKQKKTF